MAAGQILGIRKFFFMDEIDDRYSKDVKIPMKFWNITVVRARIGDILMRERYDFVFVLLPHPETHAHHKCATILALEAVQSLPENLRPAVFAFPDVVAATTDEFVELEGYPVTKLSQRTPAALFDRNQTLLRNLRLNYHLIARWVESAHKSQGSLSFETTPFAVERLYSFAINGKEAAQKIQQLVAELAKEE